MYSCTGHKHTAFGGHFGVNLGLLEKNWGLLGGPIGRFGSFLVSVSVLASKKGLIALLSGPVGQTINIQ